MKKVGIITLLVCLLIATVYTAALADNSYDPVYVVPYFIEEVNVYTDQEVILAFPWISCTRGLTVSYLTAIHMDWMYDGLPLFASEEEFAEYWWPIFPEDQTGCISGQKSQGWTAVWVYSLGDYDEPGEHVVSVEVWFDHPITDGYDSNGDGIPDIYSGTLGVFTTTIHVVEP